MFQLDFSTWCLYLIGYSFGIVIGGLLIFYIICYMWKIAKKGYIDKDFKRDRYIVATMGAIERTYLIMSFLTYPKILIVPWFVLRFASVWRGWSEIKVNNIPGRLMFNIQISGIGLNLIFSIVSFKIITGLLNQRKIDGFALFSAIVILFLSIILLIFLFTYYQIKYKKREFIEKENDCKKTSKVK